MMLIGIGIGILIGGVLHVIGVRSYQHTLRMIGEEKAVEFILGKPYVIAPETYVRELERGSTGTRPRQS